jgi:hypothetical protein
MFVYINPLPSNQIAIAKEKTNGCNQKVLQKTFEEGVRKTRAILQEGVASSRAITGRGEAWRKENSSKAQDCEAELRAPGEHCA